MNLYCLCRDFHCLPEPGGLLDQDPVIVEAFAVIAGEVERLKAGERKKR